MTKLMKFLSFILAHLATWVLTSYSQELVVFDNPSGQSKFVINRNYVDSENAKVSEVILADSFSANKTLAGCEVVVSNAWLFTVRQVPHASDTVGRGKVVQGRVFVEVLKLNYLRGTKVIYREAVMELESFGDISKRSKPAKAGSVTFEGEDLLREQRKLGLPSPDETKFNDQKLRNGVDPQR